MREAGPGRYRVKSLGKWLQFWAEELLGVHRHDWSAWKAADLRDPMAGSFKICAICHKAKVCH